ncbi:hypothetical protein [Salinadaptatus halalkaliphilus]|uniref:hypothetical protein n=1 Tax=Salinadaptatus halalkaliphilus TaxID=2419781 RepID=UPI0015804412|nr:hypothetical protein [Salinadaptatus halalkaliphilus]
MTKSAANALDQAEIEEFLKNQSMGTLSLAKENESYAIPVSFTCTCLAPADFVSIS